MRWEAIHPGRAALRRLEAETTDKSEQRAAYKLAMQELRNDYHAHVGHPFGHARLGPRRARLERTLHLARRDAERLQADLERSYAADRERLRAVVEAEVNGALADTLIELQQRMRVLTQRRTADRERIAELVAACAALQEEVAVLRDGCDDGYGR